MDPGNEVNSFDWVQYIENYEDLKKAGINNERLAIKHYSRFGKNEGRTDKNFNDPKNKFRIKLTNHLEYIRCINLPPIKVNSDLEAVLVEFRCFPHCEFLIRNAIFKLGSDWSFTIICGNLNYSFFKNICKSINEDIKIIKTDYDNLNQNEYNNLLKSLDFWKLLNGKKILIFQEDSYIFNFNISSFLEYDYIGACWPKNQNDNTKCVGNGGFSLRTKEVMENIIKNDFVLKLNSCTLGYMKSTLLDSCPEDVYFSKIIIDYNLGNVADFEIAKQFSIESIYYPNPVGGHNFWLCDPDWESKLVVQFKNRPIDVYEHRGGWNTVIKYLNEHQFYGDGSSNIDFFDLLEQQFLWKTDYHCPNKWAGIIHCTYKTPDYLECINISNMFKNKNFIKSMESCFLLITTSKYIKKWLKIQLKLINIKVKIEVIKHPIDEVGIPWNMDTFNKNNSKKIIQVGQQLRIMSSIYLLKVPPSFSKLWLAGTTNFKRIKKLLNQENIDLSNCDYVKMDYINSFEEYDELLSKNIVFIHLYDASANNTILECIIRNTPIIVNKLEAVVEYLGEDYPMYFENLSDIPSLLDNVSLAHDYLKGMDKSEFTMDYFYKKLLTSISYHF